VTWISCKTHFPFRAWIFNSFIFNETNIKALKVFLSIIKSFRLYNNLKNHSLSGLSEGEIAIYISWNFSIQLLKYIYLNNVQWDSETSYQTYVNPSPSLYFKVYMWLEYRARNQSIYYLDFRTLLTVYFPNVLIYY
jgi:hypothetical protein